MGHVFSQGHRITKSVGLRFIFCRLTFSGINYTHYTFLVGLHLVRTSLVDLDMGQALT